MVKDRMLALLETGKGKGSPVTTKAVGILTKMKALSDELYALLDVPWGQDDGLDSTQLGYFNNVSRANSDIRAIDVAKKIKPAVDDLLSAMRQQQKKS